MNQEIDWLLQEKYNGEKSAAFFADCQRLAGGEPLGFVIGHTPFLNCTIHLDSHPLIPRPETEYWVDKAISEISRKFEVLPRTYLDLCAGSGAIGVALAKALPHTHVTFGELNATHLPTIQENLSQNLSVNRKVLGEVYTILQSDLFEKIKGKFDYIFCNPPYIDADANTVEDSVINFEPHLALFGGVQGMEIISKIITQAPAYLTKAGQLWLEHEPAQVETITNLARKNNFSIVTHLDQYNIPRYSILTMSQ